MGKQGWVDGVSSGNWAWFLEIKIVLGPPNNIYLGLHMVNISNKGFKKNCKFSKWGCQLEGRKKVLVEQYDYGNGRY